MKVKLVICFALTLALGVGMAQAASISHTGWNDPTGAEGWTWLPIDPGDVSTGSGTEMGKGYWYLRDATGGLNGTYEYGSVTAAQLNASWRYTSILRVVQAQIFAGSLQSNVVMVVFDNDTCLNIVFGEDRWQYQDNNGAFQNISFLNTTSAYHRYGIVCTLTNPGSHSATDTFDFYVDEAPVLSLTRSQIKSHTADPAVAWGDPSNFGAAESHWNFVEFSNDLTIPEPVTLALPGLGVVVALLRRRQ